jgi:hypothetical protein
MTLYHISDERGLQALTHDPETAERLSRAGLRVTATATGDC